MSDSPWSGPTLAGMKRMAQEDADHRVELIGNYLER